MPSSPTWAGRSAIRASRWTEREGRPSTLPGWATAERGERAGETSLSGEDRKSLAFQLLTEFSFTALQSLIDLAGSYRAIELNRPYWHHAGKAAGLVALQSFPGLMTKDLQGWVFMGQFIEAVFRRGRRSSTPRWDVSAQGMFDHCPFQNGPPEFCYLLDYVVANGVLESLDLDLEMILDASMAEGAPVCVFSMVTRSTGSRPGGITEFDVPPLPPIPKEVLDSFTIQYLAEHWVMITRAINDYEKRDEVLSLVRSRLNEQGCRRAPELMKALGLTERGLETIVKVLDFLNSLLDQEGEEASSKAEGKDKRMVRCPFQFAPREICEQFEAFTNGIIEGIDPRYALYHKEAMCRGDQKCVRSVIERGDSETVP